MKINQVARRSTKYLNDSGLTLLVPGLAWVFGGISQLIWPILARSHPNSALAVQFAGVALSVLVLLAGLKLKQRVVFPRAGYAAPRYSLSVRLVMSFSLGGVILIWILARSGRRLDLANLSAAPYFATLVALLVACVTWQQKGHVGYWFAVYLVGLGAALWYLQPNPFAGMSWLQIGVGGPLAVYGAIRMRRFMEENPVEAAE